MELELVTTPVVDCGKFNEYVESVYGRQYSTVQGYRGDDRLGHYTYFYVDPEQWKMDDDWAKSEEGKASAAESDSLYSGYSWYTPTSDRSPSFEEWMTKEGWDAHNDSPVIDEVVWHLLADGHNVPSEFLVLVDW